MAFRTHVWDAPIADMARRLFERRGNWDFVVLADETQAAFDTAPYNKLSLSEDFSDLALPRSGDARELWFNSDYSFYRLLAIEPRYDYFCISEYDVLAGQDLGAMFTAVANENLDVVTKRIVPAADDWVFRHSATAAYPAVWSSFNAFIVLSLRALEHMLARRQELARDFRAGRIPAWPYFEAFIGSEFGPDDRWRKAALSRFGRQDHLEWWPPLRIAEAQKLEGEMLLHPVLGDARFLRTLLPREVDVQSYFTAGSPLRRRLDDMPLATVVAELAPVVAERQNRRKLNYRARRWLAERSRGTGGGANLAFGRPTLQSSLGPRRSGDVAPGPADARFATAVEDGPWWAVDLGADYAIDRLTLYRPRTTAAENATLIIRTAARDGVMVERARRSLRGGPSAITITLDDAPVARVVQAQLDGRGALAMNGCTILGRLV